jgi:hypothetical protein
VYSPANVGFAKPEENAADPEGWDVPVPLGCKVAVPLLKNALAPLENGSLPVPDTETGTPVPEG